MSRLCIQTSVWVQPLFPEQISFVFYKVNVMCDYLNGNDYNFWDLFMSCPQVHKSSSKSM